MRGFLRKNGESKLLVSLLVIHSPHIRSGTLYRLQGG
jgi:hypothetical protein